MLELLPSRFDANATRVPSGDIDGSKSYDGPLVSCVAAPPVNGSRYRCPSAVNTIVCPSGATATAGVVTSVVSRLTVRVVTWS